MTIRLRLACVLAILGWGTNERAISCSCMKSNAPVAEAFASHDAVFVGQVIELKLLKSSLPPGVDGREPVDGVEVTLRVLESWKGVSGTQGTRALVETSADGGMCGYPFRVGGVYLVWARRSGVSSVFVAHLCDRTRPLDTQTVESSEAEGDRAALRKLALAQKTSGVSPRL